MNFFFVLGLLFSLAWPLGAAQLRLVVSKSNTTEHSFSVLDTTFESTPYVSVDVLDSLLGTTGQWVPDRQKWVQKTKAGGSWVFTLDNAFCAANDRIYNLTYPVRRGAEHLFLPLHSLRRVLAEESGLILQVDRLSAVKENSASTATEKSPTPLLNANPPRPSKVVAGPLQLGPILCDAKNNGTLVTLNLSVPADPETFWVPPNYLARFHGAKLAPGTPLRQECAGLVHSILLTADNEQVQMTLQIRGNVDTIEMESTTNPLALNFLVRKASAKKAEVKPTTKTSRQGKGTVILDPGHGGYDQGASVDGIHESNITLAIGKQLKTQLEKMGYKALLTRDEDRFISLQDRPKFASEKGGDLFISLHCNSLEGTRKRKQQISGYTAYILRAGASEEDNALARRENQAIQEEKSKNDKTEISPVDWILLEHQLNLYSKQSEVVVEKIIQAFEGFEIPKYATGASQAGFFVLVGAYMPAVLFEMGFLTHDRDRAFMASAKGQKRIAQQMATAIDGFMAYRNDD